MNFDEWWEKHSGWGGGEKLAEYNLAKAAWEAAREKAFNEDVKMEVEKNTCVADTEHMLMNAERHIEKLTCELKEKECAIHEHVRRWQFYEQIVKNLTTFK